MPSPTPTPTPTGLVVKESWFDSPATRNGTSDVIGRLGLTSGNGGLTAYRTVLPGQLSMSTSWYFGRDSGDVPWYSIDGLAGILPAGLKSISVNGPFLSWSFDPPRSYAGEPRGSICCQLLGTRMTAGDFSYDFTRGTSTWQPSGLPTNNVLEVSLDYDIGYSYVAMGEWDWKVIATGDSGALLFVNGNLTPSTAIPTSGAATYDARTLHGWVREPFVLTADFGHRTMSASIQQDYRYNPFGDSLDNPLAVGIHVSGSAPFSNDGLFNIALSGTVNWSSSYPINTVLPPPTEAATGLMNGAFFGPNAEQVGGTLTLSRSSGAQLMQDAFIGQQRP